jgi:hypothetical protein
MKTLADTEFRKRCEELSAKWRSLPRENPLSGIYHAHADNLDAILAAPESQPSAQMVPMGVLREHTFYAGQCKCGYRAEGSNSESIHNSYYTHLATFAVSVPAASETEARLHCCEDALSNQTADEIRMWLKIEATRMQDQLDALKGEADV